MRIEYLHEGGVAIVYDADRMLQVDHRCFDPQYWEAQSALVGQATGRGTTWFVQQGEEQWALRHYRRGGLVGKLVHDHYLWTGLPRTRAWREWHLTAQLHQQGLPVPAPVAARVCRKGLVYAADLITQRLPAVQSLSQRLQAAVLPIDDWRRLGACLRRFHDAGLDHADLNAHNILLNERAEFWLIDLDRGRLRKPGAWQNSNLQRLQRSLKKLKGLSLSFNWTEADWLSLQSGYAAGGSAVTGR